MDVGFSLLNRIWAVGSFPVTIYLITTVFSKEVQGYYYTYNSLVLAQSIFDMGFGVVMVQFVSHEWAHLRFGPSGRIEGDTVHRDRLISLMRLGIRWYAGASGIFFVLAAAGGYVFFRMESKSLSFVPSWLALCGTATLSFPILLFRGILEGSDRIARSQSIVLGASVVATVAGWISMWMGMDLYTPAVLNGVSFIVSAILLVPAIRPYWRLMRDNPGGGFSWRQDYWPQQWRIGVSWVCGFIVYQTFVPFIFALRGPIEAGKIGLAFSMFYAVHSFAQSWVYAVGPKMGALWARSDTPGLLTLAKNSYRKSLGAAVLGSAGAIAFVVAIRRFGFPQADRFPDLPTIALILGTCIALQLTAVETQAVRFNKKEPFLLISVIIAILTITSNYYTTLFLGSIGTAFGFFIINSIIQMPIVHAIFNKYTKAARQ